MNTLNHYKIMRIPLLILDHIYYVGKSVPKSVNLYEQVYNNLKTTMSSN